MPPPPFPALTCSMCSWRACTSNVGGKGWRRKSHSLSVPLVISPCASLIEKTRSSLYQVATCNGSGKEGLGASLTPSIQSIMGRNTIFSSALLSKALPCASNFCLSSSCRRSTYSRIPKALLLSLMVGVLKPRPGPWSAIHRTVGSTMCSLKALIWE
eukprot:6428533-Heterocapsa_arctica.AAC.1